MMDKPTMRVSDLAPPTPAVDPATRWVLGLASLSSGAALVLAIVTGAELWLATSFVVLPALIAVVAAVAVMRPERQPALRRQVKVGVLGGLVATLAYDGSRGFVERVGLASTDMFKAIPIFGYGLTGRPPSDPVALAAGWAFHFVNGTGFALAYVLLARNLPWWAAVIYALVLEAFMVGLYPGWLGTTLTSEFLAFTVLGHVCFGAVVGVATRRYA